MNGQNSSIPKFSGQIRLGLVVYGGIALAIYMNGVCREFYNAVRGRGIYKLVKALTDSDIVVDIVSGTSAGGINGVLLSYALTNSTKDRVVDFENFEQIWRDSGNIRHLMRQPNPNNYSYTESILDGEGYYQEQLSKAFKEAQANQATAPADEWSSEFNELDLFITGTDILGKVYKVFQQTGSLIEVKNHRAVFLLKHRQGRKQPFNPDDNPAIRDRTAEETYQALAKLCRITSCFPVAFPVVTVNLKKPNDKIDSQLVRWGALESRELPLEPPTDGYKLHFVDGGVLDNRPFSYTIKEMYHRTSSSPVDRKLFYVDPSPDRFSESERFKNMARPDTLQVLEDSLIGMPMYESIANDLELIKEHNDRVSRYRNLMANVESDPKSINPVEDTVNVQEEIYLRSRLISMRDRILPLIFRMQEGDNIDPYRQQVLEKTADLLAEPITKSQQKEIQEKQLYFFGEQIRNLEGTYSLRKHFYILRKICQIIGQSNNSSEIEQLEKLAEKLTRNLKLIEVVLAALDILLSKAEVSKCFYELLNKNGLPNNQKRVSLYKYLLKLHRFMLHPQGLEEFKPITDNEQDVMLPISADFMQNLPDLAKKVGDGEWLPQKQISGIFEQLKRKVSKLSSIEEITNQILLNNSWEYDGKENEEITTIFRQIELASEALIERTNLIKSQEQDILLYFRRFRELDRDLYPFEYITNINEKEIINTIRISPDDAQLGLGKNKGLDEKLAGDSLYAFAGFFKKSWRSNDILWGRLDGLNRIIEGLVTGKSVNRFYGFLKREYLEKGYSLEDCLNLLVKESFPNAQESDRQLVKAQLTKIAVPDLSISESELKSILDNLVLVAHRQIINSDVQNVIEDAVSEQLEWNIQEVKPDSNQQTTPFYNAEKGYFDKTVSAIAAAKIAEQAIESLPRGKEHFFTHEYGVGKESLLKDIPNNVLLNLGVRFILIVRDLVLPILEKNNRLSRIRHSITYQFFDNSLQLFYWWLQLSGPKAMQSGDFNQTQRVWILVLQIILLAIAIIAVAITVSNSFVWLMIAVAGVLGYWLLDKLKPK